MSAPVLDRTVAPLPDAVLWLEAVFEAGLQVRSSRPIFELEDDAGDGMDVARWPEPMPDDDLDYLDLPCDCGGDCACDECLEFCR